MRTSQKLSNDETASLTSLNLVLEEKTGINFLAKMIDFAKDDKKTEVEVKEFLKQKCPICGQPTKTDKVNLSLLYRFYLEKVEEHDELTADNEVKFGTFLPNDSTNDSWRTRKAEPVIGNLLLAAIKGNSGNFWRDQEVASANNQQVEFSVSGFFPSN
jgi:hypothetical protein